MINGIESRCLKYYLCIVFVCALTPAIAQYESANWIFGNYTINFIAESPTISPTLFTNNEGEIASYSTDRGELLIATDGSTVWNGDGEIMRNGENITPYRTKSIIIPKPGSISQFYIFSYNAFNVPGNNNNMLSVIVYAIVDVAGNANQGEVVEKNKVLYNNMHGTFTISGKCDRSVFWLIGDVDSNLQEGTDKVFIFQIDKNGISGPFTSKPVKIGVSDDYKLSPDASKFLFSVSEISGSGSLIADFKPQNLPADPIVNVKWLPVSGSGEFSPNGRFIYLVGNQGIVQYDILTDNTVNIFSANFLGRPQIAANGKIYIPIGEEEKLLVINNPDQPGLLCGFEETGISLPSEIFVLPAFASNLFYNGNFAANAGDDKEICEGETVKVGSEEKGFTEFYWSPANYLDDPTKWQPTFNYTGSDIGSKSFTYKLTTKFEGCEHNDLVVIKVHQTPPPPVIYGSRSVCPGVKEVMYWSGDYSSYLWMLDGGVAVGPTNADTLAINWGLSNNLGQISLQIIDSNMCKSEMNTIEVLIDEVLQTEIPVGLDSVCINLGDQQYYQVTKTTGSTYQWEIIGGEITSDPTAHQVFVDWDNLVPGKLWVSETSVTNNATCFGKSDTLNITVFKDPSTINLHYVTLDTLSENAINLFGSAISHHRIKELNVLIKKEGQGVWQTFKEIEPTANIEINLDNFQTDDFVYQFQLEILNKCDERIFSNIHNSIHLSASGNEEISKMDLIWNNYNFWNDSEVSYEILTSKEKTNTYLKKLTVLNDTIAALDAGDSFSHFLRVRAVNNNNSFTSLSNEVKLEFKHALMVPNVFTPNNDGFNDTFEIKNIKLYPFNRLVIVNRYGQTLLDRSGYQGGWDGDDATSGIYFYLFSVPEKQLTLKGPLQIIR